MKLAVVFGTRPEAIKLAPLILKARQRPADFQLALISTGQHREMLEAVLDFFELVPDHSLQVMTPGQTLAGLTARLLERLDETFATGRPDAVVVQGDTTTAMSAALAAFYRQIPVAHVEAGLRTDRLDAPFPEEANRRIVSQVARWHFAPTVHARDTLRRDGLDRTGGQICVTGNTVIDALLEAAQRIRSISVGDDPDVREVEAWLRERAERRLILVTGHRRESFGAPFREFCEALRRIAQARPEVLVVYPVHLNPNVQAPVREILGRQSNVRLTEPKGYPVFVRLMMAAHFLITDSGGVQEEAPALGKPVLVTREITERPEAVAAGVVQLVGTTQDKLIAAVTRLLDDAAAYRQMARGVSPYGDGQAAARCLDALLGRSVAEFSPTAPAADCLFNS